MNLTNIKQIVNSDWTNWEKLLLEELANDKNVIPNLLSILNAERNSNKELITDLNALLSKAHIGLDNPKMNKDKFMQKEIKEFYESGRIGHCFKMD